MRIAITVLFLLTAFAALAESVALGDLTIEVPSIFELEARHQKDRATDGIRDCWQGPHESVLWLDYFASLPKSDGGPIVVAKEEPIEVTGQKVTLIETEVFAGGTKKVLVVYLQSGEASYRIVSEHVSKEQFKEILKTVRLQKKD